MDEEIMEALHENPFQQYENLQLDQDLTTVENDEGEGFISNLSIDEDSM